MRLCCWLLIRATDSVTKLIVRLLLSIWDRISCNKYGLSLFIIIYINNLFICVIFMFQYINELI